MTTNTGHLHIGNVKAAAQRNTMCTAYCNLKKINKIQSYSLGVATHLLSAVAGGGFCTQMSEVRPSFKMFETVFVYR